MPSKYIVKFVTLYAAKIAIMLIIYRLRSIKYEVIRAKKCLKMLSKYNCKCGNTYKHASSLWNHKQKCCLNTLPDLNSDKNEEVIPNNKDVMIEKLVEELTSERAEKSEMKSMFMLMMEKYQEMQMQNQENTREMQMHNQEMQMQNQEITREILNKVIDVLPKMGNMTNSHNTNQQ